MAISVEDREEIREILHETIMKDHEVFDDLLKNVRRFRESPEGRLAVVETEIIEIKENIKEIKIELRESRKESKNDLDGSKKELKDAIEALRREVKDAIEALRREVKGETEALRREFKGETEAIRREFKDDIKDLKHLMLWLFGIMFTLYGGLIIYLINKMGS